MTEIKQIGTLSIDTGQLLFCDPAYLRYWKDDQVKRERKYEDTTTGKVYVWQKDFQQFDEKLIDRKTVNELIGNGRLRRVPYDETGEFSHSAVTQAILNKGYAQCRFPEGFDGMAIAVAVPGGDGEIPVFAEFNQGMLVKIWMDF